MTNQAQSTRTSRLVNAPRETIYQALTDPEALATWRVPGDMTATMHHFDLRVGGGYQMSLFYPTSEAGQPGKTTDREDRYTSRFVELKPPTRLVEAITFDSDDPAFADEMRMTVTLEDVDGQTHVTMVFEDIPIGVSTEDNDAGTQSSLEKLAHLVEQPTLA